MGSLFWVSPFVVAQGASSTQVTLEGTVVGPDGKPVAGAGIYLAVSDTWSFIKNGYGKPQTDPTFLGTSNGDGTFRVAASRNERLQKGDSVILVAEDSEICIGFTQLFPSHSSVSMQRAWILTDLFVVPEYRRWGVGCDLIKAAIEFGRRDGLCESTWLPPQTTSPRRRSTKLSVGSRTLPSHITNSDSCDFLSSKTSRGASYRYGNDNGRRKRG